MRGWSVTPCAVLLLLAVVAPGHALTLSSVRLDATAVDQGARDSFRLAGGVADLGTTDLSQVAVTVVVGEWRTTLPAGSLQGKNGRFTHTGTGGGLAKLKVNAKKGRLLAVGRGIELGALPAPALVRIELGAERFCGRFGWTRETVQGQRNPRKRRTRKVSREAPAPCEQVAPLVQITTPTFADGVAGGDLSAGDEIQGDGVFTGRSEVGGDTVGELRFRVAARTTSQPDQTAYSPIVSVYVIQHVTPAQLADAITLANDAQALYDQRIAAGSAPAAAGAEVVAMLQGRGVLHAEVGDGGVGVSWLDANEILGGILGYEQASHRAAPGRARPAVAPRPRAAGDATNVGSRRALILAPFFYTDEPDDVEALLDVAECPSWEVEAYADGGATVETFMDLDRYGIVLIASHGTPGTRACSRSTARSGSGTGRAARW